MSGPLFEPACASRHGSKITPLPASKVATFKNERRDNAGEIMIKTLRLDRFQRQGLGWPAAGRVGRRTSLSALNVRPPESELWHFTEVLQEYSELSCPRGRQVLYYRGSDGMGGPARSAGMSNDPPSPKSSHGETSQRPRPSGEFGRVMVAILPCSVWGAGMFFDKQNKSKVQAQGRNWNILAHLRRLL